MMSLAARVGATAATEPIEPTQAAMPIARRIPRPTPNERADQADDRCLDEDERGQLCAGRAGSPQERQLADAFDDGHRQRVDDQERAGEQGDRGDQRGRGRELAGRRAQVDRQVVGGRQQVGRIVDGRLERGDGLRRGRLVRQRDVDTGHAVGPERGLRGCQRRR